MFLVTLYGTPGIRLPPPTSEMLSMCSAKASSSTAGFCSRSSAGMVIQKLQALKDRPIGTACSSGYADSSIAKFQAPMLLGSRNPWQWCVNKNLYELRNMNKVLFKPHVFIFTHRNQLICLSHQICKAPSVLFRVKVIQIAVTEPKDPR